MASVAKRTWTHNGVERTKWVVRYTDGAGERRLKTFDLKKEADKFRTKVETEVGDGEHVPDAQTVTIARLATLYLEQVEARVDDGRVSIGRFRCLESNIRTSIVKYLGRTKVKDLTARMVDQFYLDLQRIEKQCPRTAKDRIATLKLMQDFAIKRGFLARRPASEALADLRGIKRVAIRTFTSDEMGRLLAAAKQRQPNSRARTTPMLECIVHLAAFCGLRFGEIMALSRDAIDLDARVIHVRHSLCRYAGIKGPKSAAGVRDVPFPAHLAAMLREWIATGYVDNPDGLVFRNGNGGIIRPPHFHQQMWHPLLRRAGLFEGERFRFHALRHFAASWMIAHHLPVTDVAQLMGHAKFDLTLQVYAHPITPKDHRREAFDRMAATMLAAPHTIDSSVTHHA